MSDFFDMVTPKPGDVLEGAAKKYPVVHVDAAKHLQLFMRYKSVQTCVQAREKEIAKNLKELGTAWNPWLPKRPGANVIEARLMADAAVMYSRAKKQREFDQCGIYLYISKFGIPASWIMLVMLAIYEGGDSLANLIAHNHGSFRDQLKQLIHTGI